MKNRLYVAYGSNLNIDQMTFRCPNAKLYGTGVLENYELQFKGRPHMAFATIGKKEGANVPVALWEISKSDEKSLDIYEGFPKHYTKENVEVNMGDKSVEGMVYVMNQKMTYGLPSKHYYDTVLEGYRDCGLDKSVLKEALVNSAQMFYNDLGKGQLIEMFYNDEENDEINEMDLENDDVDTSSDPFYYSEDIRFI